MRDHHTLSFERETITRLEAQLHRYARHRVGSEDQAHDLVQDTWLAALAGSKAYEGRASQRTWLTSILHRKVIDTYRAKRVLVPLDADRLVAASPPLESRDVARHAQAALDALPARDREVIELCCVQDLDRDEAAKRLGVTRPSLRVMLSRARKRLRMSMPSDMRAI